MPRPSRLTWSLLGHETLQGFWRCQRGEKNKIHEPYSHGLGSKMCSYECARCIFVVHMLLLKSCELPGKYECMGISCIKMSLYLYILQSSLYSIKHLRLDFSICWYILIPVSSYILSFGCVLWEVTGSAGFVNDRNCKLFLEQHRKSTTVLFSELSVQLGKKRGSNKRQLSQCFVAPMSVRNYPILRADLCWVQMTVVHLNNDSRKLHKISKRSVFCPMLVLKRKKWTNDYVDGLRTFP